MSISLPHALLHNPVTDAIGHAAKAGAKGVANLVLPDGAVKKGANLLIDHPGAGADLAKDGLRFRHDHPDAATAITHIATGARSRPVKDTALATVDLVHKDPAAVKDALSTAVDFTVDNDSAVRDAIRAFLP
ncbi:MAG: hypothetical protein JWP31_477 [Aeromicrobium sp.]|nr:hypothetical protein [Aeromicrobium sp.]